MALTAELATVAYDGPRSPNSDDRGVTFYHSLGASIRYLGRGVQPFVCYVLPFRFGDPVLGHVVTAGFQAPL